MTITAAVQKALRANPGSIRSLAKEAGISHSLLALIVSGRRAATRAVAEKLAAVLDRWGKNCSVAAQSIRNAIQKVRAE